MTETKPPADDAADQVAATSWNAVLVVAVSVACLITVELLPASLLTPMAAGLRITEGMAGQSLTATASTAIFASLFAASLTRGIDRRRLVMAYSALLAGSSLLAALGTNFATLLAGRALLGVALGGFWAVAPSLALRLASPQDVPRALSVVFGGVSVALVVAAPAGSFLGAVVGWRGVFLVTAVLGLGCLVWQAFGLPRMPARGRARPGAAFALLRRPGVPAAMLAVFAVFAGQFAFFTYMRPFFETVSGFGVQSIPGLLLVFGVANFIGTSLSSAALKASMRLTLALAPLVLAVCAGGLLLAGHHRLVTVALIAAWGFVFGTVPVAWSTWITRNLADEAESAGGLQVATIQIANTFGAAVGGYLLDAFGANGPVAAGGVLLAATFVLVITRVPGRLASSPAAAGAANPPAATPVEALS